MKLFRYRWTLLLGALVCAVAFANTTPTSATPGSGAAALVAIPKLFCKHGTQEFYFDPAVFGQWQALFQSHEAAPSHTQPQSGTRPWNIVFQCHEPDMGKTEPRVMFAFENANIEAPLESDKGRGCLLTDNTKRSHVLVIECNSAKKNFSDPLSAQRYFDLQELGKKCNWTVSTSAAQGGQTVMPAAPECTPEKKAEYEKIAHLKPNFKMLCLGTTQTSTAPEAQSALLQKAYKACGMQAPSNMIQCLEGATPGINAIGTPTCVCQGDTNEIYDARRGCVQNTPTNCHMAGVDRVWERGKELCLVCPAGAHRVPDAKLGEACGCPAGQRKGATSCEVCQSGKTSEDGLTCLPPDPSAPSPTNENKPCTGASGQQGIQRNGVCDTSSFCATGAQRLSNNMCCSQGQEVFNDQCLAPCSQGTVRNAQGQCQQQNQQPTTCPQGFTLQNGMCMQDRNGTLDQHKQQCEQAGGQFVSNGTEGKCISKLNGDGQQPQTNTQKGLPGGSQQPLQQPYTPVQQTPIQNPQQSAMDQYFASLQCSSFGASAQSVAVGDSVNIMWEVQGTHATTISTQPKAKIAYAAPTMSTTGTQRSATVKPSAKGQLTVTLVMDGKPLDASSPCPPVSIDVTDASESTNDGTQSDGTDYGSSGTGADTGVPPAEPYPTAQGNIQQVSDTGGMPIDSGVAKVPAEDTASLSYLCRIFGIGCPKASPTTISDTPDDQPVIERNVQAKVGTGTGQSLNTMGTLDVGYDTKGTNEISIDAGGGYATGEAESPAGKTGLGAEDRAVLPEEQKPGAFARFWSWLLSVLGLRPEYVAS